jgi:hypothetical protein
MAVAALEIKTRQPIAGGRDFGSVGHYMQLDGTAHFAADPAHPLNNCITDIQLAPRDGDGRVHFSADICILAPEDPRRGNHRLLFDVPNRGNRLALAFLVLFLVSDESGYVTGAEVAIDGGATL